MAMCSLCRRTLLAGERYRTYVGERFHEHAVCELCEEDAQRLRWLRGERGYETVNATGLAQTVRKVA
ncbi:MAG TPA: hypothetical protein VIU44_13970 [Gaiellaceae bacterium]|jgi:hypothetical protein